MTNVPHAVADYSRFDGTIFNPARLRTLKAIVVGAGALGNEVVRILGLLGVGGTLIIDPDRVESSNLTRSVLFRLDDFIGRNKAEALARGCETVFADTEWRYQPVAMADAGLGSLADADIIFGCVDSDLARIEIAVCALKLDKPVVDGGLGADGDSAGRISVYAGREHACYACQLMPQTRARVLGQHFQKRFSCTPAAVGPEPPVPSTPALASIVGSLMVDRGIRHLFGAGAASSSHSLELRLDEETALMPLRIPRDPICPFHSTTGNPVPVRSAQTTFQQVIANAGEPQGRVVLDWPVCILSKCHACGLRWAPMRRLGLLRNHGACPSCGSEDSLAIETVAEVDSRSIYAREPIARLGLPEGHLLWVNPAVS